MITTILLLLLWLLIVFHLLGGFFSLCSAMRYRDVSAWLDAERIGHQPFQPRISLVVHCDLRTTVDCVPKIQANLSLNYIQYEVIVSVDSTAGPEAFAEIVAAFELERTSDFDSLPIRGCYRSRASLYRRLTLIDRGAHRPCDGPCRAALAVARGGYLLFVDSPDNELIHDSLANLAILKMRDTAGRVDVIRGVGRHDCAGTLGGTFFKLMADLANLRRIYITGALKGADYGQFLILREATGRHAREEFVPQPQMYLHRPNRFRTYAEQLVLRNAHPSSQGRMVAWGELLIGLTFWGAGIHVLTTPGVGADLLFLLSAYLFPVIAATFSIWIGEIVLRRDYRVRLILKLLLVMPAEALIFCLLQPVAWGWSLLKEVRRKG